MFGYPGFPPKIVTKTLPSRRFFLRRTAFLRGTFTNCVTKNKEDCPRRAESGKWKMEFRSCSNALLSLSFSGETLSEYKVRISFAKAYPPPPPPTQYNARRCGLFLFCFPISKQMALPLVSFLVFLPACNSHTLSYLPFLPYSRNKDCRHPDLFTFLSHSSPLTPQMLAGSC
ncbi:uncharacterized protein NDAI_0F04380 [Naumovozyma dairenensis CBS 421]|uniref:Uncharacterized protein n=1 Tax=Naumovozyma dairenensis (strain ATCC 10597 / BCRC 20456 / CBS 421 / NBRC 0211 / NRRL Y-12639) TaxID=1071378 RepID=G0WD95_NAUDC|nr:hypothetical protein NDAI_0F04380 [Naumovozyma dairenensis CBS 421]CCD25756.1 hypothetical protein NDAI_0F04380 [Naumovozyma dairenensis CBS 421]